jgi:hypothetical protein
MLLGFAAGAVPTWAGSPAQDPPAPAADYAAAPPTIAIVPRITAPPQIESGLNGSSAVNFHVHPPGALYPAPARVAAPFAAQSLPSSAGGGK